jgi:hypothetical protein
LPPGTDLTSVWERNPNEVYVWGQVPTNTTPNAALYRFDGTNWTAALTVSGQSPSSVFGVGAGEVFAATSSNMWRSIDNGKTWVPQAVPLAANFFFGKISGTLNNVQVIGWGTGSDLRYLYRFDGSAWSSVYNSSAYPPYTLDVFAPNEGYFVTCWGWGQWNGTNWNVVSQGFDFCDIYDTWAMRDAGGTLHWWAIGNNNFANGIRIWCFDNAAMSFGCKYCYCFSDGSDYDIGGATGIWGSGTNDVYVIGALAATSSGQRSGRIYHFDGNTWSLVTAAGGIYPLGISGTSANDVWISGMNGALLRSLQLADLDLHMYAGLNITGSIGATYQVQYSPILGTTNWQPLAAVTLSTSPCLFFDTNSASAPRRFYRAVLMP